MKKTIRALISILLCVSMLVTLTLPVSAARTRTVRYISDLRIAYGKTATEAKNKLTNAKYTPIEFDLNKGNNDDVIYLGYKVTTEAKYAITDIAAMNMNGDYTISKYDEVLRQAYDGYVELGEIYEALAKQFKVQYEAGSQLAKQAYDVLNMYFDDDSQMKMGDWFLKGKFFYTDSERAAEEKKPENEGRFVADPIVVVLTQANSDILTALKVALAMSVGSFDDENNVFTRLSALPQAKLDAAAESHEHYEKAKGIYQTVESLGKVIKSAEEYAGKLENVDNLDLSLFGDSDRKYIEAYLLSVFMKEVKVGNGTLYDIVTKNTIEYSDIYPIIMALGDGQYEAIQISGILSFLKNEMISSLGVTAETNKLHQDMKSILQDLMDEEAELEGKPSKNTVLSIYSTVDRSIFGSNVGVTSNANASMAQDPGRSPLLGNIDRSLEIGLLAGMAVAGVTAITSLMFAAALSKKASAASVKSITLELNYNDAYIAMFDTMENNVFWDPISEAKAAETTAARASTLSVVGGVAMGVMMIVSAVFAGMELYNYYHPTYKEIPLMMTDMIYDNGEATNNFVRYDCVRDTDGKAADINGFDERQWIALYFTKDVKSGGCPLKESYITSAKSNYTMIHTFGSTEAYNLSQFSFKGVLEPINLGFEKGDRNLLLASSFTQSNGLLLAGAGGLLAGFGSSFAVFMGISKRRNKKKDEA